MKIQLLPSTFDEHGAAARRQHLPCFLFDDVLAVDAGSLALAVTDEQRQTVRDIIITHSHLDHVATLPIFIDDLFSELENPIRVHATSETVETLEEHIFNWKIFPRFSELTNDFGVVMVYSPLVLLEKFAVKHLEITAVPVSHQIPTIGLVISDASKTVAFTSDTAETADFWNFVNVLPRLDALLIECAFPDRHAELARVSHHLTPSALQREIGKLRHDCPIYAVNLKPAFRAEIISELEKLQIPRLEILQVGKIYEF